MGKTCININHLPNEMLLKIFSYFSVWDLEHTLRFVCSRWSELCSCYELWKNSTFSIDENMSVEYVSTFLEDAPKLQLICLEDPKPEFLDKIAEFGKNIRKLDVHIKTRYWKEDVCEEAFENLCRKCQMLEEIIISGNFLSTEHLVHCVGQLPNLYALSLKGQLQTSINLKYFAGRCTALRHLDIISMCWHYGDMEYFLKQKKEKFLSLRVSLCSVEGTCILPLLEKYEKNLREVHLFGKYWESYTAPFNTLNTLSNLLSLRISKLSGLKSSTIAKVFMNRAMSHLLELSIEGCLEVDAFLVKTICNNCPNLWKLGLRGSDTLTDDGFEDVHRCRNLNELDIYSCKCLTSTAIDYIGKCNTLKYLNVGPMRQIRLLSSSLVPLSQHGNLRIQCCHFPGQPDNFLNLYLSQCRKKLEL